jgi:adenosylcobinamide-phosphate synthase
MMENYYLLYAVFFGFLLDQLLGDPPQWPHPIVGIGKAVAGLERLLNHGSQTARRLKGVLLTIIVVGGTYLLTYFVVRAANAVHPLLGLAVNAYLIFTTLAAKSLLDAGRAVLVPLTKGELQEARSKLSWFVSRDTSQLSEDEIVRGTIETLAENFVDGILSPLLYAALGGAPLAMAFKAISTLDSMVGYRNEQYEHFGWFSARFDDWANYIPARLSVILLLFAGFLKHLPVNSAFKIWKRDASSHPSPNGGNPESIVAGLLGVRLGGINIYHGRPHHRAEMGESLHPMNSADIIVCRQLVRTATWLSLIPALGLAFLIR